MKNNYQKCFRSSDTTNNWKYWDKSKLWKWYDMVFLVLCECCEARTMLISRETSRQVDEQGTRGAKSPAKIMQDWELLNTEETPDNCRQAWKGKKDHFKESRADRFYAQVQWNNIICPQQEMSRMNAEQEVMTFSCPLWFDRQNNMTLNWES